MLIYGTVGDDGIKGVISFLQGMAHFLLFIYFIVPRQKGFVYFTRYFFVFVQ